MTRKHMISTAAAVFIAVLMIFLVSGTDYDWQAVKLTFLRVNLWFLTVTFYAAAKSLIQDDDYDEDWTRINSGNLAVAVFRGAEFASVGIAAGMLIAKI